MSDTLTRPPRPDGVEPGAGASGAVESGPGPERGDGRWWHVVVVGGVALVLAVLVLHPFPLDRPVLYRGDAFQHEILTGVADGWGSPGPSTDLAAPASVDWSVFPTGTERIQLVVVHALRSLTGEVIAAVNLYLLLGVVATAALAFLVLRWMGLRPVLAGATAVVFSFSPAFSSAVFEGHLFLFALYPVALAVWLALWSTMSRPGSAIPRRELLTVALAVLVMALSSAYYTTFGVMIIVSVGAVVSVHRRSVRSLVWPVAVAVGMIVVAGASLLPDLLARRGDSAAAALHRTAADVWRFSLRPQDLLVLDSGHPLGPVARGLRSLGSDSVRPGTGTVLGLFALAGCLACLWVAFRDRRRPDAVERPDRVVRRLAVVVVAVLAVATVGGLGTWLGELGFTQIRAWSRMVVVLSFTGLSGGALLLQRRIDRTDWGRGRTLSVIIVVALLAVLDQGMPSLDPAAAARQSSSDASMVAAIEGEVGADAAVFELPVVSFPDDPGSGRLLAPAVHSDGGLRFSAGFFRGGASDWQLSWCRQPAGSFVRAVTVAGFDVLLVQRSHHLVADPERLEAQLDQVLGKPTGRSDDGAFIWYDLRPLRSDLVQRHGREAAERAGGLVRRPVGIGYSGVTDLRMNGRQMADGGSVELTRLDGTTAPVELTMHVVTADGESRTIRRDVGVGPDAVEVPVPGPAPRVVSGVSVIDRRALTDPVLDVGSGDRLPVLCM